MTASLRTMPAAPAGGRRRLQASGRAVGVDQANRVIRGYVVAQAGAFKTAGRGSFDAVSLRRIVELWPSAGLKSRFSHPTESSDGLGRYLGRSKSPHLSTVTVEQGGKPVVVQAVRANLHLDRSSFVSPDGNLAGYLMSLAESDPNAISSSLVLSRDEEYQLAKDGSRLRDADGEPLPPVWRPKRLYASDVVDEGDAVDGFFGVNLSRYTHGVLSAGCRLLDRLGDEEVTTMATRWLAAYLASDAAGLPDEARRLLDRMFTGRADRVTVEARATAWLGRYLERRRAMQTRRLRLELKLKTETTTNPRILRRRLEAKAYGRGRG